MADKRPKLSDPEEFALIKSIYFKETIDPFAEVDEQFRKNNKNQAR